MKRSSLVAFGLALTGAAVSQGAILEYSANYGPTSVPFASTTVANLSLFDPGLGTLTKVTLNLEAETSAGTIAWDNEAQVGSDVTLGIGAEVTASAMTALTAVAIPLQTGDSTVDADNDGAADYLGTDAFSLTGGSGTDDDMDMSTLPATLALFTGLGTFPVDVSADVETFLSTSGGFGPIDPVPGLTEGTVKVIYEYTPIPEPATLGLFLLGMLNFVRRRR